MLPWANWAKTYLAQSDYIIYGKSQITGRPSVSNFSVSVYCEKSGLKTKESGIVHLSIPYT